MSNNISFIDAVNEVLAQVGTVQGATGRLTDFTESGFQRSIDVAIQTWNEAIAELYDLGLLVGETASATMTLVADTREYSLPSDFEKMAGRTPATAVWRGATTNHLLTEYKGGYEQMIADQLTATDFVGPPNRWVINPTSGNVRIDTDPTSTEANQIYNALYEKEIAFTSTASTTSTATGSVDVFPFSDTVTRALIPAVAELWKAKMPNEKTNSGIFRSNFARAASHLSQKQARRRYGIRYA